MLHEAFRGNLVSDRHFRYGDPETAFAEAPHRFSIDIRYPRNSCTPIETYGVVAEYDAGEDAYDVLANFQGPFSIHAVMARALKVPGNRLRLRTPPDSGGSFGVKQGVFPYIVLIAAAARVTGRPVKWIEDRLEHLTASVSATNRVTTLDGRGRQQTDEILALDWDQVEDCGAHLRAPEPATLYRMHGNLTGAYDIRHVAIRNRVVVTNKTPTGLNRGFGGPQVYFALERLMQRIAIELGLDPLDVITRNLIHAGAFPYRTATGALLDSGNYQDAVALAVERGRLAELKAQRDEARAQGRLYGIGFTAVVEPSVSNMGYITTVLTAAERRKAGPKNGAQATATVGARSGRQRHAFTSPPCRRGRAIARCCRRSSPTCFGLQPEDIRVNTEIDTAKDAWSIASGNYSSRFAAAVAGTAQLAAERVARQARPHRRKPAQRRRPPTSCLRKASLRSRRQSGERGSPFSRVAALSHWSPGSLPDDAGQTHPRDRVLDAAGADAARRGRPHQFLALPRLHLRFLRRRDRSDDAGRCASTLRHHARLRHASCIPAWSTARSAAALRRRSAPRSTRNIAYAEDGSFPDGNLRRLSAADHDRSAGAADPAHGDAVAVHAARRKGRRRRQLHATPVCLANAVADALGVADIDLPLTPARLAELVRGAEPPPPAGGATAAPVREGDRRAARRGTGLGKGAPPEQVWAMLLDPAHLAVGHSRLPARRQDHRHAFPRRRHARHRPGQRALSRRSQAVRSRSAARGHACAAVRPARSASATPRGGITLAPDGNGGTQLTYSYDAAIGGKVASHRRPPARRRHARHHRPVLRPRWRARPAAVVRGRRLLAVRVLAKLASLFGGRR